MVKFERVYGNYYNNFQASLGVMSSNSTNLDRSSYTTKYVNPEQSSYKKTDFSLVIVENILLKKYLNFLKSKKRTVEVSNSKMSLISKKPWYVSMEEYGTPDLWYLVLALNDCVSCEDFSDLSFYYIVDLEYITNCIEQESSYIRKNPV